MTFTRSLARFKPAAMPPATLQGLPALVLLLGPWVLLVLLGAWRLGPWPFGPGVFPTWGLLLALASVAGGLLRRLALDRVRHAELSALHLHRLKTPLAMIKLRCDLMRLRPGLSEALCGDLMEQSEEVELLAAHMEQSQRLFRSPGDGRERTRGQLGPAWLEGHVQVFAELLAGQGRRLSLQLCETAIRADPEALRLALGALLENAQRHATGDVLLSTHARGDRMALTVADQGPGLPPSVLENLAPPWTWILRADAAPRRGLGLPLLLALAEAEGWGLRFRSSGRSGLRVTLDLHPGTVASELQGDGESLRC